MHRSGKLSSLPAEYSVHIFFDGWTAINLLDCFVHLSEYIIGVLKNEPGFLYLSLF